MSATFLIVPQWQGSGSSRAMRLLDGAAAIKGDLPSASTRRVDVPLEAGDAEGSGIHRLSSLRIVRERLTEALAQVRGPAIVIGGDCGVEHAAVEHAARAGRTALVWLDAHADANTPESSPSGAFHGMVVRTLVDESVVAASDVVLAGTRAWDDAEVEWVEEAGVRTLDAAALADPDALADAVAATGAERVYVHVDLDVLDPSELGGLTHPEPFGPSTVEVAAAIRALVARSTFAGGGVTEFAPVSVDAAADDLGSILRIVGALASGAR